MLSGRSRNDRKPGAAVSSDKGRTWTDLQTVGTEFGIKNAVFPTVIAGDDDRAALAYLGTPTGGNAGQTGVFPGVWHLYVDYTYDGGKTWVTSDATPTDPVQRGSICTAGTTCGDDRNLLDFMDITTDDHGRVLVGFADGCIGACVTDPASTTHDAYASIARQGSGKTLFSKYDTGVVPSPAPSGSASPSPTGSGSPSPTGTATAMPTGTATAPLDTAPVARAAAGLDPVRTKQQVVLSAVGTSDNETPAAQLTYAWNFGSVPGAVDATGPVVTASFPKRGVRTATVTVTDPQGLTDTESVRLTVQRRRACETARFHNHGPWRLIHRGGDHHKHCDNLGQRTPGTGRDRVDLTFDGTSLTLGYGRIRSGGKAVVVIDGRKVGTISFAGRTRSPSFRGGVRTYAGLTAGTHRLRLLVTGRAYLDYAQY